MVNDVNPSAVAPDGGIAQVESQARVIELTSVLLRAIAATGLTNDPEFNGSSFLMRLWEPFAPPIAGASGVSAAEARTLSGLRRRLAIKRADKVLVVEITMTSKDAQKSATIANAIADAYLLDQAQVRAEASRRASSELTARLEGLRARVLKAEGALEQYKKQNNIVSTAGQPVVEQQLADVSAQLSAARSKTATLRAQIEHFTRLRQTGVPIGATSEIVQSAVIGALREQEGQLVQVASDLQSQYGPRHPKIAAVESQIKHLRELIANKSARIGDAVKAEYERAQADERLMARIFERLKNETLAMGEASIRLRELQRDLEANRSVYNSYSLRSQETLEQASVDTTNAEDHFARHSATGEKLAAGWPDIGRRHLRRFWARNGRRLDGGIHVAHDFVRKTGPAGRRCPRYRLSSAAR